MVNSTADPRSRILVYYTPRGTDDMFGIIRMSNWTTRTACAGDAWSFGVGVGSRDRDSAHSPCQNLAVDILVIAVSLNCVSTVKSCGAGISSA